MLLLVPAGYVEACSCGRDYYAPACELVGRTEVIFLGSVDRIEDDPLLRDPRSRLYRFRVKAVYKGLPLGISEVVVNPGNPPNPCGTSYAKGFTYLMFGEKLTGTGQISSPGCSGSRVIEKNDDDLHFLEAYRRKEASNSVYGRVLQSVQSHGPQRREEDAPVEDAQVTLRTASRTWTQRTTGSGEFRFERLPRGSYLLTARREPFIADPAEFTFDVPAIGCVEVFPKLDALASISGTVVTPRGQPARKQRVQLLRRNRAGVWYSSYGFWQETDDQGRFVFAGLPEGDYLLGNEIISGRPSLFEPYPTLYYPGATERDKATVLHLKPHQSIDNLRLVLPRPHTPRTVLVKVVWPDGTTPLRNLLQLLDGEDLVQNEGGARGDEPGKLHRGVVRFTAFAERTYDLNARYWVDDLGGRVPFDQLRIARSKRVRLEPGVGPATIRLVLDRTLLAVEEE